ncbi:glutathione S-transferase [Leeia sp. TBRC 13508]|uniref:Glutathione S-transferase n=1 Tax=Leeia speluncae TaxID=2884804 RepID=A0ABS8D1E5_9NEIS|nr:glutathione S-transferase [Leeia speluncae]MCB6182017.1 glutathione S-transferase [Leeia speluncae]
MNFPVLYSYRRCPYAMRARMALKSANMTVEVREISLRAKPAPMLEKSPKGTVPVLVLANGQVIEQSLEIMHWAISQSADLAWYPSSLRAQIDSLIATNDGEFKASLDRYKYPERYPDLPQTTHREMGEIFLTALETCLSSNLFLLAETPTLADFAIFPFIRQFAKVDPVWFEAANYPQLRAWLSAMQNQPVFDAVMQKYPTWTESQSPTML